MKIHPISDLHLDHAPFRPMDPLPLKIEADVVVIAGDLSDGTNLARGVRWMREAFADKPVIYVAGNHEYYGRIMADVKREIRELTAGTNIHFLDNEEIIIDNVRFLGSTLWTDFELDGPAWSHFAMQRAGKAMADFSEIQLVEGRVFRPYDSLELHRKAVEWLKFKLSEPFAGETVVATHHGWSRLSIHPRFKGNLINPAFASNLEDLLGRCAVVIHGHMHNSFDYEEFGTRVIVNPRGYCKSNFHSTRVLGAPVVEKCENGQFNPYLVVEI